MNDLTLEEVLNAALLDEYSARDTYRKIIETFGAVRPFVNIVEAEQRHIESLLALYEKYGVSLPAIPDPEQIDIPDTLLKACEMGVVAEIDNVTLYDRLVETTDLPDVVAVLQGQPFTGLSALRRTRWSGWRRRGIRTAAMGRRPPGSRVQPE